MNCLSLMMRYVLSFFEHSLVMVGLAVCIFLGSYWFFKRGLGGTYNMDLWRPTRRIRTSSFTLPGYVQASTDIVNGIGRVPNKFSR